MQLLLPKNSTTQGRDAMIFPHHSKKSSRMSSVAAPSFSKKVASTGPSGWSPAQAAGGLPAISWLFSDATPVKKNNQLNFILIIVKDQYFVRSVLFFGKHESHYIRNNIHSTFSANDKGIIIQFMLDSQYLIQFHQISIKNNQTKYWSLEKTHKTERNIYKKRTDQRKVTEMDNEYAKLKYICISIYNTPIILICICFSYQIFNIKNLSNIYTL